MCSWRARGGGENASGSVGGANEVDEDGGRGAPKFALAEASEAETTPVLPVCMRLLTTSSGYPRTVPTRPAHAPAATSSRLIFCGLATGRWS